MTSKSAPVEEYVMVVPTAILSQAGNFQGLCFDTDSYMKIINDSRNIKFLRRDDVETDPNYKQIIPYAILAHEQMIFSYLRGKLLNEKRLQGSYSIGVGGHITADDVNLFTEAYMEGMYREITEEISINSKYSQRVRAVLNDDSNDVGRVHFGIVHLLTLEKPQVSAREKSINQSKFVDMADLIKDINKYENWSRICINHLGTIIGEP